MALIAVCAVARCAGTVVIVQRAKKKGMTKMAMTDKKWIEETLAQAQMIDHAKKRSSALDSMKAGSGLKDEEWAIFTSMFEFAYAAGVRDTLAHCPLVKSLLVRTMQAEGAELRPATDKDRAEVVSRGESEATDEKAHDEARVQPEGTLVVSPFGEVVEPVESC